MIDYKSLKSGTDIRGTAVKTNEKEIALTDEAVLNIAASFSQWLSKKTGKNTENLTVAIGRDCRISGERIRNAAAKGLTGSGVNVIDCGLSSTPSMFMITLDHDVDGTIQITASHHPYQLNGLKFFTKDGGLQGNDISEILKICESSDPDLTKHGSVTNLDYMDEYCNSLRKMIVRGVGANDEKTALEGFHIVVDAGNGVGGFYAEKVLKPLGADVTGSVFLDPDGMFPNHIPNPENPDAMESIKKAVLNSGADLGLIFDTDVDRAGCVDNKGNEINRNRLIALASVMALEKYPGGTIVTDSVTSTGLKKFIEQIGGKHYRYKRGYRNVINKAIELTEAGNVAPLAIETSGHAAFKDNYFLDDGAYLMTRTVILLASLKKQGKSIENLIGSLEEPYETCELRMEINEKDFRTYGEKVLEELDHYAKVKQGWSIADDNREGIRVFCDSSCGNGWFLLRLSVHDPVMPLNVESNEQGGCLKMVKQVKEFLDNYPELNFEQIDSYLM